MRLVTIILGLIMLSFSIVGCEDDDDEEEGGSIIGEWVLDDPEDVYYTKITADSFTDYDYQGDDFDEGDDCYDIFTYPYTIDGNEITIDFILFEATGTYRVSGDVLTITLSLFGEEGSSRYNRMDFDEASFSQNECVFASGEESEINKVAGIQTDK
jgi:hypothetical protein